MSQQITTQKLLDMATEIAVSGKRERLSSTQINSFLEYAQQSRNVELLSLFIIRQSQRGHFVNTGKLLVKYITQLNDINMAIELLGYVKWLNEAIEETRIDFNTKTFQDLLKQLTQ
ncbi:hypothetical protein D1867_00215 [Acidianus infernus]|uniref:Uncharacterized protein n=1 Tax=Acidianus infernus TaxID=12915 RepID=A0A6A9Q923_ACIIN|nr:hypothetical protein [Acidianus infernus]MUM63711.1 hypothetical protein [Acidianus infernus]